MALYAGIITVTLGIFFNFLTVISYQFEEEFTNTAILDSEGRNKEFSFLTSDSVTSDSFTVH
jgi:hypothetical protein